MNPLRIYKFQKSMRFRRWNRAGYAVFASLAGVVSIGVLTSSISEKSLGKSENIVKNQNDGLKSINKFDDNEPSAGIIPLSDVNMLSEQNSIIINQTTDCAAAFVCVFINQYERLKLILSASTVFLFFRIYE